MLYNKCPKIIGFQDTCHCYMGQHYFVAVLFVAVIYIFRCTKIQQGSVVME
jgi:hypothetical protein